MELKLKFRFAGIILAIFCVMIILDWYKNIDYVSVYDEKVEERIPSAELYLYSKKYEVDVNKQYKWESINSIRKTKTAIPFVFNREVISSTSKSLLLMPNQ
jgi:hypothetical protein